MEGFKKMTGDVREAREYEGMVADSRQMKADLLYIAMMADIDLDEDADAEKED